MLVYFGRLLFLQNTRKNFFATEISIVDHFCGFFMVADPYLVFTDPDPVPPFSNVLVPALEVQNVAIKNTSVLVLFYSTFNC
jgi:hypothetical protein